MKMKITTLILSGLFICAMGVMAEPLVSFQDEKTEQKETLSTDEKGKITVDKKEYDFGTISEDGGLVTTVFTITNNTEEPILITRVRASCGCTTPEWTKEPIEPGKTGEVKVSYNPKGRVAPFNKSVTISTNGEPQQIVVRIKGVVE